ncbi:MAG: valine--tRNA ligase [Eubacteriaceae bacterium]|jgi:valyl-tRNA synthetase|nr:valine--tRNA ligase [Eubacteriaceae bacterium]
MAREIQKTYDPQSVEPELYERWEKGGYFKPEAKNGGKPYTIVMPPPNITGQLHMGHAFDCTLQDILIRFKRMQGFSALWLPGEDHASLATEVRVKDAIWKEEGMTKEDLGREAFLSRAWEWSDHYRKRIAQQLRKLGSSCDWTRERFTMDEGCSKSVTKAFVNLYNKGLVYRDNRIINWCPDCKTALSDAEVEYKEAQGHLWYIRYPIKGSSEFITVATTRPETMLGDSAVAVNPNDERFANLVGKFAILPLMNKEIPIISDSYVEMDYGTGCVKITPCHDPNDFEVGKRHNLEQILVLDEAARVNENGGKYCGMDRYEARKAVVNDLSDLGLLEKIEEMEHSVGECHRCHHTVEPITSVQWFVKMKPLAEPALEAVNNGSVSFVPDRFKNTYYQWMENIRDWCISRQLWWGHRIPAYFCDDCGEIAVATEAPQCCPKCGSPRIHQEEDALDTWFSSALWPFSTLGWPDKTADLAKFYPNDVLVTGFDIIFFWVARMVFSGIEHMGSNPFQHVFIHGIIRDEQGRKMSKSLDNGIDPLEMIEKYGADALRATLVTGVGAGNDQRWQEPRVQASRNFCNKLNNAARFIQINLADYDPSDEADEKSLSNTDKWIISRTDEMIMEVTENLEKFELGVAMGKMHGFVWNEYCDWYIEFVKPRLFSGDDEEKKAAQQTLYRTFISVLKLLHPFMPYITEDLYQCFSPKGMLIVEEWPAKNPKNEYSKEREEISEVIEAIRGIRNVRASLNVSPSLKAKLFIRPTEGDGERIIANASLFQKLAGISEVAITQASDEELGGVTKAITPKAHYILPLDALIDIEAETARLTKERDRLSKDIERAKGKLSNRDFLAKAPKKIVDQEKLALAQSERLLNDILESLLRL